ncbi:MULTISPECIES: SRPBCC family protein [unclassified Streptomyces]|uniref:SRPBCC family protein n=1 Tax=unclassified Streptomyces TaxID=2593676 RepID=UPI00109E4E93|nr:SRPBCC family protein [Streptomyces sp. A1136]THA57943.1 SRPBCC family protein [Streptomyces sp. A1136]
MRNVQRRTVEAPASEVGPLLDLLSTPQDRLWPAAWSPLRLDAGLAVGSAGGHGRIRYEVSAYEPGSRVHFAFTPGLGLEGYHEFVVIPDGPARCQVVHTASGHLAGGMRLLWPLAIRPLHEALLADLLDNIEREATGRVVRPARWSLRVRLMRRFFPPTPVPSGSPAA